MAVTNTGIVLRTITGVNESDLFLDSESTSVATNTGIVERSLTGVNESDLWLDSESTSVVNNTGIAERSVVGVHDANFVHPIGDELITNNGFDDASGWTKGIGWSIADGKASCSGTTANLISNIPITPSIGKQGRLSFEVTNYVSGQISVSLNGTGGNDTDVITPVNGFYEFDLFGVMKSTSTFITIRAIAFIGSIDSISLKAVLVNRESTVTNTGVVERIITGVN